MKAGARKRVFVAGQSQREALPLGPSCALLVESAANSPPALSPSPPAQRSLVNNSDQETDISIAKITDRLRPRRSCLTCDRQGTTRFAVDNPDPDTPSPRASGRRVSFCLPCESKSKGEREQGETVLERGVFEAVLTFFDEALLRGCLARRKSQHDKAGPQSTPASIDSSPWARRVRPPNAALIKPAATYVSGA